MSDFRCPVCMSWKMEVESAVLGAMVLRCTQSECDTYTVTHSMGVNPMGVATSAKSAEEQAAKEAALEDPGQPTPSQPAPGGVQPPLF